MKEPLFSLPVTSFSAPTEGPAKLTLSFGDDVLDIEVPKDFFDRVVAPSIDAVARQSRAGMAFSMTGFERVEPGQRWECIQKSTNLGAMFTIVAVESTGETFLRADDHRAAEAALSYLFHDKKEGPKWVLDFRRLGEKQFSGKEAWKNDLYAGNLAWSVWRRMRRVQ